MAFDLEPTSPIQATTKLIVYAIVIYFLTRPEIADYFMKTGDYWVSSRVDLFQGV